MKVWTWASCVLLLSPPVALPVLEPKTDRNTHHDHPHNYFTIWTAEDKGKRLHRQPHTCRITWGSENRSMECRTHWKWKMWFFVSPLIRYGSYYVVNSIGNVESLISPGDGIAERTTEQTAMLYQLSPSYDKRRHQDVQFPIEGRVWNISLRRFMLHGWENWPLSLQDASMMSLFDNRSWESWTSNGQVYLWAVGDKGQHLMEATILSGFCFARHYHRPAINSKASPTNHYLFPSYTLL